MLLLISEHNSVADLFLNNYIHTIFYYISYILILVYLCIYNCITLYALMSTAKTHGKISIFIPIIDLHS